MKPYVSSIVSKYGDIDRVKTDAKTLKDILARQGTSLLIDVLAETVGENANLLNLNASDRLNILNSLVAELKNAILERT